MNTGAPTYHMTTEQKAAKRRREIIDIDSSDSFLDAPDIVYQDGTALLDILADEHLGHPSPDAPKLPTVDH